MHSKPDNMTTKKICTRCVMDTTDSAITFDANGVCDHCTTFDKDILPFWNYGKNKEKELEKIVSDIKKDGRKKDFDCIIGMSGGIDSSYLVYLAKEVLDLNPLVFHVDAGWNSQVAVNNIEKIVDGLNLDLYTEVINWEEMKDLQLSFFKSGVPHIDAPQDHSFFAKMYSFASKYNVKNILTGGNYSTECIRNPIEWMYYQSDSKQMLDIHKKYGTSELKTFPTTNILWHKIYLPYLKGIKVHRPLDMMKYDKEEAKNLLVNKFGFQEYPQKHFESRFTKFYEGYWLPERFGYDTRKVQFSSLILTGQMTRDQAIQALEKPALSEDEARIEFDYVCNKMEIDRSELESYFTKPKKTYKDFKSQQFFYEFGSKVMKRLGLERGGKR